MIQILPRGYRGNTTGFQKCNGMKKEKIYQEGTVLENLPSTLFRVKMDDGREILAHLSGRMRLHYIRVLPGDRVRLEMTPYDETKGRIVHRLK